MDTNVLPKEPQAFLPELLEADRKVRSRDERAMANVGFGATTAGLSITTSYLGKVTEEVIKQLSGPRPRSNTIQFQFERVIRQLDPELVALACLQSGLHAVGSDQSTHRDAVITMGAALADECWAAKLLQTDKKLAHRIAKQTKETYGSVKLRKAAAKKAAEDAGFTMAEWTRPMLVHAGQWVMNVLLAAMPNIFELTDPDHSSRKPHSAHLTERLWTMTDEGLAKSDMIVTETVLRSPVYQPRTTPPVEWTGFWARVAEDDRTVGNTSLLRTGFKDVTAAARHAMRDGSMAPTVAAVNALQSVPFKINTWIMEVIKTCAERGIKVAGLPAPKALEVPSKLSLDEFKALPVEVRKLRSKTRKGAKKANRSRAGDIVSLKMDMKVAERLAASPQFYTPMNMDWRGRVYSMTHFNFQREDRVRALFLFANGEPIGEEGIYWLKVHVANCGAFEKVDKKPLEDRIAWVDANMEQIETWVVDPINNTGWTEADSPFLFLASCSELYAAVSQGPEYVTHIPVIFDGSCSGLQHLAAMTRAPEGCHVNLTDNEKPADVYQLVADIARARIEADLESDELFGKDDGARPIKKLAALALAYGVDRKLVKRNVMTFAYSSKEFGMSEQHFEDTMEPLELKLLKGDISEHPFGDEEIEWRIASRYLAKRTLEAIKTVVSLPADAMAFMQSLAKALAHEGKPLRWVTPAGLPCINRYHERTTERVNLWLNDKGVKSNIRMTVATGYEKPIAKDKAAAGISPNLVHSMDAAHLLLTVVASVNEGITDIATVHDSFGCLPSRATRFNQIIREVFLRMYTDHDVLAELLASARADLTPANHEKLPELPEKGALNLTEIINAKYAFA